MAFSVTENKAFSKMLSYLDLFENTVFFFLWGPVKTELFKSSLGTMQGQFAYLFLLQKFKCLILLSNIELLYRISSFLECHSVFMWMGIFSKMLLVWTRIFI